MWETNHVRPRQWCSSVGMCVYLRSIDVFCFLFGCRKHINQLRVWGAFAIENELSPGNLKNDRLVPLSVGVNRDTWYMIHDRISPLFSFTAIFIVQSSLGCVCQIQDLPEKKHLQKKAFKKTGDFCWKFPNLPQWEAPIRKTGGHTSTSDILVIHEDVQAWVYPRSGKKWWKSQGFGLGVGQLEEGILHSKKKP